MRRAQTGGVQIDQVQGDITRIAADVIVNAANSGLYGGGGVDGAIHRAGGPAILAECRALRLAPRYRDGLAPGQAVATTAGDLPARWVIHTVGPIYRPDADQSAILRSCYTESLRLATELGAMSIAFPLISAGAYLWPKRDAIVQALTALRAFADSNQTSVGPCTLVLFDERTRALAREVAGDLG